MRSAALLLFLFLSMATGAAAEAKVDFEKQVKPILESRCVICHQSKALFGKVNLENAAMAFRERPGGPAILKGKPDSSPLYFVLKLPPKNPQAMPPTGHRIPDKESQIIYRWILQGAEWPEGAAGVLRPPAEEKKS
jgi:mono/diheme cytochrome c family protein